MRADPTSEGMVAPIVSAEDSRAVADRRKRRKKDGGSADEADDDENDDMGGDREGEGESSGGGTCLTPHQTTVRGNNTA